MLDIFLYVYQILQPLLHNFKWGTGWLGSWLVFSWALEAGRTSSRRITKVLIRQKRKLEGPTKAEEQGGPEPIQRPTTHQSPRALGKIVL